MTTPRQEDLEKKAALKQAHTLGISRLDIENIKDAEITAALKTKLDEDKLFMDVSALEDAAVALRLYLAKKKVQPAQPVQADAKDDDVEVTFKMPQQRKTNEVVYEVTLNDFKNDSPKVINAYKQYVEKLKAQEAHLPADQKTNYDKYQAIPKEIPATIAADGQKIDARQVIILRFKSQKEALDFINDLKSTLHIDLEYKMIPAITPTPQATIAQPQTPSGPSMK